MPGYLCLICPHWCVMNHGKIEKYTYISGYFYLIICFSLFPVLEKIPMWIHFHCSTYFGNLATQGREGRENRVHIWHRCSSILSAILWGSSFGKARTSISLFPKNVGRSQSSFPDKIPRRNKWIPVANISHFWPCPCQSPGCGTYK